MVVYVIKCSNYQEEDREFFTIQDTIQYVEGQLKLDFNVKITVRRDWIKPAVEEKSLYNNIARNGLWDEYYGDYNV